MIQESSPALDPRYHGLLSSYTSALLSLTPFVLQSSCPPVLLSSCPYHFVLLSSQGLSSTIRVVVSPVSCPALQPAGGLLASTNSSRLATRVATQQLFLEGKFRICPQCVP